VSGRARLGANLARCSSDRAVGYRDTAGDTRCRNLGDTGGTGGTGGGNAGLRHEYEGRLDGNRADGASVGGNGAAARAKRDCDSNGRR